MAAYEIEVAGNKLQLKEIVRSIHIKTAINQVPSLRIRLSKSDLVGAKFKGGQLDELKCGAKIEVGGELIGKPVFKGNITELKIGVDGTFYLDVIAHSELIKLTEGYESRGIEIPENKGDKELIEKITKLRGLSLKAPDSKIKLFQFFIYNQTPWRAMMNRVLANGFLVVPGAENKIIDLSKHQGSPHKIELGDRSILGFAFKQDDRSQLKEIKSNTWSVSEQKAEIAGPASKKSAKDISPNGEESKSAIESISTKGLPITKEEAKVNVDAEQLYRELDRFQGHIEFTPIKDGKLNSIKLADRLELSDAGSIFNGKYLVSGLEYNFSGVGWSIKAIMGLHLNYTLFSEWMSAPPIPAMIAKVLDKASAKPDDYDVDTRHIPITIPTIEGLKSYWCRLAQPFASNGSGFFFPPNKDDEVLIEFIGGDCRFPVITGSLYSKKNDPPHEFKEENNERGIYLNEKSKKAKDAKGIGIEFKQSELAVSISSTEKKQIKNNIMVASEKPIDIAYDLDKKDKVNKITLSDKIELIKGKEVNFVVEDQSKLKAKSFTVEVESKMEVK